MFKVTQLFFTVCKNAIKLLNWTPFIITEGFIRFFYVVNYPDDKKSERMMP